MLSRDDNLIFPNRNKINNSESFRILLVLRCYSVKKYIEAKTSNFGVYSLENLNTT